MSVKISMADFLMVFSDALDQMCPEVIDHHLDVAYWAGLIGKNYGLPSHLLNKLVESALLHDIGIFSLTERSASLTFEFELEKKHAYAGAFLLAYNPYFKPHAEIIYHHHDCYEEFHPDMPVPVESQIIFLADRLSVLIDKKNRVLIQKKSIRDTLFTHSGTKFNPVFVAVLDDILKKDAPWLDFQHRRDEIIRSFMLDHALSLTNEGIAEFGRLFLRTVDFRARTTAAHSVAVGNVIYRMAELLGLHAEDCMMLRIAGYFHDIGKVIVPSEILEKPAPLTSDEMEVVKEHPYYTFKILSTLQGFEKYAEIASQHHEAADGTGYPYQMHSNELHPESNLLIAADIFAALIEERSYRKSHELTDVLCIMMSYQPLHGFTDALMEFFRAHGDELKIIVENAIDSTNEAYALFDRQLQDLFDRLT